jgi:hypothetical protein
MQIMTQMSANSILYFTWSISRPVYRQLMPKPDKKEGKKGGKEGRKEGGREEKKRQEGTISYLLYYSHLWCEIAA